MSLRDDTLDESTLPLESSTPNRSIDTEALATGPVQELVSDIGNGEFTNDLIEGESESVAITTGDRYEAFGRKCDLLSPAENAMSPAPVVSEAGSENFNEDRESLADITTWSMNTLEGY